jgi:cytochrome c-type biogenesis protein CcmH
MNEPKPVSIETLKRQLEQLKELHASGTLNQTQFAESKAALERRILDLVMQAPSGAEPPSAGAATSRPSARLVILLAAFVLIIAALGYWWKGSPSLTSSVQAEAASGADPSSDASHSTASEQIAAMTERLATRLKEKPDDAEGWSMLARSYSVLGRHPEALKAYERAIALRPDDASLLADYADSMAVKNDRKLAGEPIKLIERALKLDPRNVKALALAGTHAFDLKDYAQAVKYWEQVIEFAPADSNFVQQVEPALAEARSLAGLPPAAPKANVAAADKPVAGKSASVSGTVSIAPTLLKQSQPDDTVFIFARAAEGSRMPLAIVRKQVKDLPLTFTLDDSMAMSPANQLSGTARVIVGARVSKSGNAMPQAGDFSGQVGPVSVGANGLTIEIKEAVKP